MLSAGVELRRSGRRLVGCCPFHDDHAPSLVVYPGTSSYFCFGCEAGGDVIDFVGRLRRTAFRETAAFLATQGAVPSAVANVIPLPARSGPRQLSESAASVIEAAVDLYARQRERALEARSYLRARGIDAHTAAQLRIGYAAGGLAIHLRKRGLDPASAQQLGLLTGDRDALAGRIVIPDLDERGRATWLTGRTIRDRSPRYLNLRMPSPLLGLARARANGARAVVVTEGPFDWLTACTWGVHAVALLGTHASRDALLALRSFKRVYLALDADGPGRRATAHLATALGARAVVVPLPAGTNDLNELGRRRDGRDAFLRSVLDARTRLEQSWLNTPTPEHRARAA